MTTQAGWSLEDPKAIVIEHYDGERWSIWRAQFRTRLHKMPQKRACLQASFLNNFLAGGEAAIRAYAERLGGTLEVVA